MLTINVLVVPGSIFTINSTCCEPTIKSNLNKMKIIKKLLLLLTLAPCIAFGQTTPIPDARFEQALIALGYDTVLDGSVTTANINTVETLTINFWDIDDFTGIEGFAALTYLNCEFNHLTSLDLSNNTALTVLYCGNNELTSLDVSNNTALTYMDCKYNQLTSLEIGNNTILTKLDCHSNQLTSLDVSGATSLDYLNCRINSIQSLDVSNNTALTVLICNDNQFTSLDVSNNAALTDLWCAGNQLTSLDISNNPALADFWCATNQLTSLDVSNNAALTSLVCDENQLNCLAVNNGNNANMSLLWAYNNPPLTCIEVDDAAYSNTNWVGSSFDVGNQPTFSEDCNIPCDTGTTGIAEAKPKDKELLTITDILGRPSQPVSNRVLFYIYDDGSVEKRAQLE